MITELYSAWEFVQRIIFNTSFNDSKSFWSNVASDLVSFCDVDVVRCFSIWWSTHHLNGYWTLWVAILNELRFVRGEILPNNVIITTTVPLPLIFFGDFEIQMSICFDLILDFQDLFIGQDLFSSCFRNCVVFLGPSWWNVNRHLLRLRVRWSWLSLSLALSLSLRIHVKRRDIFTHTRNIWELLWV